MKKLIFAFTCLFLAIPCQARIITVNWDGSGDYLTIQAAIDSAFFGDTIIVADGNYTGEGNRDIYFRGKAITVRSANGPQNCIIDCNGSESDRHRGFIFDLRERVNSVLNGFTITNGYAPLEDVVPWEDVVHPLGYMESLGGAILCWCSNPTITNCTFTNNKAICDTFPARGGGITCYFSYATITNCTFSGNSASMCGGGIYSWARSPKVNNCIFYGDSPEEIYVDDSTPVITYCNVEGGWSGTGNINVDPCFADPCNGDYHLKSKVGRWHPNSESWVQDDVTSPCIDAGNPGCPLGDEPVPNGNRINMGAYGGTAEASKSPANWRNIADLTNNWVVDSNDFKVFVDYWLEAGKCIPSDLDRSQSVDFNDFAIFGRHWSHPSASVPSMTFQIDDCNMAAGLSWSVAVESNEPRFSVWVEGHYIHFKDLMYANCCPEGLGLERQINGNQITLYEIGYGGLCDCMCYFPITATLGPFEDGTYTVEVFDNYGKSLGVVEVTIGEPVEPGISYQIDDCNQNASGLFAAEQSNQTRFSVTVDGQNIHFKDMMVANCCPDKLELQMVVEDDLITIYETEYTPGGCFCICNYPVTATLGPFEPGTYTFEVYEDWGGFIGSTTVVIGP